MWQQLITNKYRNFESDWSYLKVGSKTTSLSIYTDISLRGGALKIYIWSKTTWRHRRGVAVLYTPEGMLFLTQQTKKVSWPYYILIEPISLFFCYSSFLLSRKVYFNKFQKKYIYWTGLRRWNWLIVDNKRYFDDSTANFKNLVFLIIFMEVIDSGKSK